MRKFLAIAVIVTLAAQGPTASSVAYACQMSGQVSTSCCCKSGEIDFSYPALGSVCQCCQVTVTEAQTSRLVTFKLSNGSELRPSTHPAVNTAPRAAMTRHPSLFVDITYVANSPPPTAYLLNNSFRC